MPDRKRQWDLNAFVGDREFSEAMVGTDQEVELFDRNVGYHTRGTLHFAEISGKSFRGTMQHSVVTYTVIGTMNTGTRGSVLEA